MLTLSLLGCQQLEDSINKVSSRVDEIENTQIASIKKQLASMDESVDKLEKTDRELKGYIETLQGTANDLRKSISDSDAKIEALQRSLDQAIKDAQNSDSALKSELEQQIASAKTDVLSQLASAKTAMESRLEQIESTINTLQQKDADLEKKIGDLRTYVDSKIKTDLDSGINSTKDWATATFATLEQYNAIVSDISGIRGSIATLESSLKSLEDSLTGRIQTAVSNAIAPIKDQMVSEAAAEVVAGYTEAISSVRSEVEEISSRMEALEDEVKLIKEDVDNIKKEIEEINSKLDSGQSGGIQSIIFVPEYSDGKATMYYSLRDDIKPGEMTLRYEILPVGAAERLAADWETSLSIKAVYTLTRAAAGESVDLPIKGASASDGILTVTASGENLDEAFFLGDISVSIRLQTVLDGVQNLSSYLSVEPGSPDVVKIDGRCWSVYNVGADEYDLYGTEFNFDDAQNACPKGWRPPTKSEFESLAAHCSSETVKNGIKGRWFSGSKTYSASVPAVFLPYLKGYSDGDYWSSAVSNSSNAYSLNFNSSSVNMYRDNRSNAYSVRCVKN